ASSPRRSCGLQKPRPRTHNSASRFRGAPYPGWQGRSPCENQVFAHGGEADVSLEALIPSAIDGLMLGFVYGLAAMGLTLIFGVMRVINLSHGPVIALGMFVVYTLFTGPLGVNPYLGIVAALVIGLAFGVVEYFVALDRAAAELMGIDSRRMLALAFGIGTSLAMVSGALLSTLFPFNPLSGTGYEVKSFVIVVLGGLGNPTGALVGGIVIGLLEGV